MELTLDFSLTLNIIAILVYRFEMLETDLFECNEMRWTNGRIDNVSDSPIITD